jgi:hypothetical protein
MRECSADQSFNLKRIARNPTTLTPALWLLGFALRSGTETYFINALNPTYLCAVDQKKIFIL